MEYVYLLSNKHVPYLVKFGFTTRHPHERADELSVGTGVPGKWVVRQFWEVTDGYAVEQVIFQRLKKYREGNEEYFRLSVDKAIKKISATIAQVGIDPVAEAALQSQILEQEIQYEKARLTKIQFAVDAFAKDGWETHIRPWCHLIDRANALMKQTSLSSSLAGLFFKRDPVDLLRSRDIYPEIIKLIGMIFHAARQARKWRLEMRIKFGVFRKSCGSIVGVNRAFAE